MVKKIYILVVCFLAFARVNAQRANCYAEVVLDRNSVYVQQPFKVTITVYTATWYTAPLQFNNLQIPHAFIIPFEQTTPAMFKFNNQPYAALTFYYIVFPYTAGKFTIPSLDIQATTPPLGQSTSRTITIHTPPKKYVVKGIPGALKNEAWLVAKGVNINQSWNKSLAHLKVGDIIKRTITVDAHGTLPQFIPQLPVGELDFASTYPEDAELKDTRDEYDANGELTQTVTYLLEKEGKFTIPAAKISWWDPLRNKLFSKSAPATNIRVAPNPNLGMMATLKDSLAGTQQIKSHIKVQKGPFLIFGYPWYWVALYGLAAVLILYFIVRIFIRVYKWGHHKWVAYKNSEPYWFKRFQHSPAQLSSLFKNLYVWWDRFIKPGMSHAIGKEAHADHEEDVAQLLDRSLQEAYRTDASQNTADADFKKTIKAYRKKLRENSPISENSRIEDHQKAW